MSSITFYGLTTLGGDYSGEVLTQSISDGNINNSTFNSIWNTENEVNVWMERVN
jgi:MoaA/NifB/PqqE/SkfB family radical SAM enzyme